MNSKREKNYIRANAIYAVLFFTSKNMLNKFGKKNSDYFT